MKTQLPPKLHIKLGGSPWVGRPWGSNGCHHSCSQRFKSSAFLFSKPQLSHRLLVKTQLLPISHITSKGLLVCRAYTILAWALTCAALSVMHLGGKLSDWKDLLAARFWNPFQVEECCGLLDVHLHHLHIEPAAFAPALFTIFNHLQMPRRPPERREPTSKGFILASRETGKPSSISRSFNLRRRVCPACSQSFVPRLVTKS